MFIILVHNAISLLIPINPNSTEVQKVNILHLKCSLILEDIQTSRHVTSCKQARSLIVLQRKMIAYEFVSHFSHDVTSLCARGGSRN